MNNQENNNNTFNENNINDKTNIENDISYNHNNINPEEGNKTVLGGEVNPRETKKNNSVSLIIYSLISMLVSAGSLYLASYFNSLYALLIYPIYSLIGIIITKNKDFTLSFILGSMFGALFLFIMSIKQSSSEDLFTYLSIECVAIGIINYIVFSLVYKAIFDKENVKGIHILELIILIAGIAYGSYYTIKKYPNYISKYLYCDNEIVARTEKEYIVEMLKSRYGFEFYCDTDLKIIKSNPSPEQIKVSNLIDQNKRRISKRYCGDEQGKLFIVESVTYSTNKYVVYDEYANMTLLNESKENLSSKIMNIEGVNKATISLYSQNKCHFIGECVDVEEYYKNIENENNIEQQYKINNELSLKNYIGYNEKEFINEFGFKYQVKVEGIYNIIDENYFDEYVEKIITIFNEEKYQNTNGMEIIFYEVSNSELKIKKAHYIIEKSRNKTFENYRIK